MSEQNFDEQILADKLSKLNSSQQSIESLSRWCISHRNKAKQIVETWDKLFKSVQREQRVSFLYLANDILQNSRRKGSEFVNEYWKVLPAALKHVYENGSDHGKKAASRLVDIWEERKVFGSRGQNLKDEMLGKSPPPQVSNGKNSNPIKIVKRDANSLRIKLAVGGTPEKILTAFQSVHDENAKEEGALSKCRDAVHFIVEMGKDVEHKYANGSALVDEILEQENVLRQCAGQLESAEALRVALVSQLKEALQDQESKLEIILTELQVARGLIEQAVNMRQRMALTPLPVSSMANASPSLEAMRVFESSLPSNKPAPASPLPPPPAQPVVSFSTSKNSEEENKKAAAAAVAAKLAASTSSAQMLTSVLSSLVAEEAASMRSGFSSSLPMFPSEKRQKLEKPMVVSDVNSSDIGNDIGNVPYFTSIPQQPLSNVQLTPPTSMQAISQANQIQGQFLPPLPPPPPPPPLVPPSNSPVSQFVQSAGLVMGVMPYGYGGGGSQPAAPAPSSHVAMGLARPEQPSQPPPTQQHQQPQSQHQQLQSANGGYYRPSGVGFYGQSHQPTPPPPLPRQ